MNEFVKAVQKLSAGKRVKVHIPGQEPIALGEPPVPDPSIVEAELREVARTRAAAEADMARINAEAAEKAAQQAMHDEIRQLLEKVVDGQERIVKTLHLPVVPTKYDKDGRIAEARRKE